MPSHAASKEKKTDISEKRKSASMFNTNYILDSSSRERVLIAEIQVARAEAEA